MNSARGWGGRGEGRRGLAEGPGPSGVGAGSGWPRTVHLGPCGRGVSSDPGGRWGGGRGTGEPAQSGGKLPP
jgi:hypothetical protein